MLLMMKEKIDELLKQMTLEEKASLCSGLDMWSTKPVDRLGVPSVTMADGPHGLRKQTGKTDHMGINQSVAATCFPSGATTACSWDRELIEEVGGAIAEECLANGVGVVLGPAVNIKRSPLCGRNFEYYSEDPFLSAEMAAGFIAGVQSRGVGTSIKHFAANNQEYRRFLSDSVVDERTLREIYLASFEGAVRKAKPWTVMCSYNKLNGEYTSEHQWLLTRVLREEWGFEGVVVSDWAAVNERVKGLRAGLDLEMPSSAGEGDKRIVEAVRNGGLDEAALDLAAKRLLRLAYEASGNKRPGFAYDEEKHHALARRAARESIVLLKNEGDILPLKKQGEIAVIGTFAKAPRYQGGGSSHVAAEHIDSPYEEICKASGGARITYRKGYRLDNGIDKMLVESAKAAAGSADAAILFVGLPDKTESEGYDRANLRLPENQRLLMEEIASVQPQTVVVLMNASPVEMPWLGRVKGLFEAYLGGQAVGGAVADLLFGDYCPCGKLAETFPVRLQDNPSYLNFPGYQDKTEYLEKLFVGYRWYDAREITPLFPFGYGLSYTSFEYSGISLDKTEIDENGELTVRVNIKNTGGMYGKEIVQLYVRDVESSVCRPVKELKAFGKVGLLPGEEKTVSFTLGRRAFAYYDVDLGDWYAESGEFEIMIGRSGADILQRAAVTVRSAPKAREPYTRNSTVAEVMRHPFGAQVISEIMAHNVFVDTTDTETGDSELARVITNMLYDLPLRALSLFSQGQLDEKLLCMIVDGLNGKDVPLLHKNKEVAGCDENAAGAVEAQD